MIDPLYAASGFVVGALVGLTGVGGGSLMTPVLILLFGVHPATAVGTDLLFAAATKSLGAVVHAQGRTIEWRIVGRLALGSVPAAGLTIFVLRHVPGGVAVISGVITPALALALLVTAGFLLWPRREPVVREGLPRTGRLTVAAGAGLGVLVSLTSVGAGALGVTVLTALYPRLALARVVGSDIAHAIPLTLLAGMGYWSLGLVDVPLLQSLLSGSLPGIVVGSMLGARVPARALRLALAGVLALVGVKMLA